MSKRACPFVSIPLWCDCDTTPRSLPSFVSFCFNPTMVRLRPDVAYDLLFLGRVRFNPTMVRLRLPVRPIKGG